MQQIREDLADVKHGLNNTQVELQILEEQVRGQEKMSSTADIGKVNALDKKVSQLAYQLTDCSAKIASLEKAIEKQQALLSEVAQLRGSLTSVIQSLQKQDSGKESVHKVKAGDSLEKIARMYKVSISALKEENDLSTDRIVVGQELRIPGSSL
jgi:LysM repeat protein